MGRESGKSGVGSEGAECEGEGGEVGVIDRCCTERPV